MPGNPVRRKPIPETDLSAIPGTLSPEESRQARAYEREVMKAYRASLPKGDVLDFVRAPINVMSNSTAGLLADILGKGKQFEDKYAWTPKTQSELDAVEAMLAVMGPGMDLMDYLKIPAAGPGLPTLAGALSNVDRAAARLTAQQAGRAAANAGKAAKTAVKDVAASDAAYNLANKVAAATGASPKKIMAYQGSPHLFAATPNNPLGELDASKIGSGEGAQAYGHGHYLAQNRNVGQEYRMSVAGQHGQDTTIAGKPVDQYYSNIYDAAHNLHPEEARQQYDKASMIEMLGFNRSPSEVLNWAEDIGYAPSVIDWFKTSVMPKVKMPGHLYTHDLSDEAIARMLDWDKPLSEQSQHVKDALSKSDYAFRDMAYDLTGNPDPTGGHIARTGMNPQEFAEHMRSIGIPGVKYLDQESKARQSMDPTFTEGTRNFVLFPGEEAASRIIKREKAGGLIHKADGGEVTIDIFLKRMKER